LEGRSWRKDFYEPYKKNRAVARAALTESEQEEDKLFWETFDNLKDFLGNKTNCTVMQHSDLEADDLIAGWIQAHPHDHHTIVSSDTDFYQLLADNVNQYNGIADELHTIKGIFDKKGKPVIDKKTKEAKVIPDPKWILFEKCMRGDPTDNVFSAYPGVRKKGTKNKVGLEEAFQDRETKGFAWNNLMLQRWTDHNEVEHRVLDDYQRNVTLVDLTAQPDEVKVKIAETIADNSVALNRPMVGAQFLKFCGKYDLVKMADMADSYVRFLEASYPEKE
jgi:5'-3' exonuclease